MSVIIPNYNHALFLKQRIESVLNQKFQDFEVIILDDCSTDNSHDIIELYRDHPKVKLILYNIVNSGSPFKQWKKGIDLSSGDYIWIAESDDYCDITFLEKATESLHNHSEASLVYCNSIQVNEKGEYENDLSFWYNSISNTKWNNSYVNDGINEINNSLSLKNTIPNASAVLFRKNKVPLIDKQITSLKLSGDWLFWIKMLERGNIIYITSTINYFRVHGRTVRATEENRDTSGKEQLQIHKYLLDNSFITKRQFAFLHQNANKSDFNKLLMLKIKKFISLFFKVKLAPLNSTIKN